MQEFEDAGSCYGERDDGLRGGGDSNVIIKWLEMGWEARGWVVMA